MKEEKIKMEFTEGQMKRDHSVYKKYWDNSTVHFVETGI